MKIAAGILVKLNVRMYVMCEIRQKYVGEYCEKYMQSDPCPSEGRKWLRLRMARAVNPGAIHQTPSHLHQAPSNLHSWGGKDSHHQKKQDEDGPGPSLIDDKEVARLCIKLGYEMLPNLIKLHGTLR